MHNKLKKHKKYTADKLIKVMKKVMDKPRYLHTLGVSYTAASLAMTYGEDIERARIAGLLHDCGKPLSNEEKIRICQENKIYISDSEYALPHLLHAKVGMYLAEHEYGIKDRDILSSIRFHTTGKPGMNLLEKIIYIADYIEPGRCEAPNLPKVRKLAFKDLDKCLYTILKDTLDYLDKNKASVDPATRDTFIYYSRLKKDLKEDV